MSRFVTTVRHQCATEYQDPDKFGVFFVWRLKRQSPEVDPSGLRASSKGEYKLAKNPTSEHPKSKTPKFRGLRGFYFLLSGR